MSHNHIPTETTREDDPRLDRWRSFDFFWATSAQLIFVRSSAVRASAIHHGALPRPCSSLPVDLGDPDGPCHDCRSFANDLTVKMHGLTVAWIDRYHDDPTGYLVKAVPDRARDVIRDRASAQGLPTRPERAAQADWVIAALPDPDQRQLLVLMLFYVQSNDAPAATPWPVDRFANRLGQDPDVIDRWVEEIPVRLSTTGPTGATWVQRNLIAPLEARLTTDAVVVHAEPLVERPVAKGHAAPTSTVEESLVTDELQAQIDGFLRHARALHRGGLDPVTAVKQAAPVHLDPDDADRLLGRPDLGQAAERITRDPKVA